MPDQPIEAARPRARARRRPALAVALVLATSACALPGRFIRGFAEAAPAETELLETGGAYQHAPAHLRGQVRFAFDAFGSLSTDALNGSAIPWKLLVAALALDRHELLGEPLTLASGYASFQEHGFLRPARIANWDGPQPELRRPLGVVAGVARRGLPSVELEIAALGCATCHSGPLYGPDGSPTGDTWLGAPNASMDLSGFGRTVTRALERRLACPDALMAAVTQLYPHVTDDELSVLRKHVVPAALEKIRTQIAARGYEPTFEHGGPGLMNGVGGLLSSLGALGPDEGETQVAWMSPPNLAETTMRKSLLVDATYAPAGSERFGPRSREDVAREGLDSFSEMVTLFVLTTFSVEPEAARGQIEGVRDLVAFLDAMRAPPFPGVVDTTLALEGEGLYRQACAGCHGTYSPAPHDVRLLDHPNRLVAHDRMGTDPARGSAATPEMLRTLASLGWEEEITARSFGGYVAPDLTGVWASAPYLHNGSVPTLWHLLRAEERPTRFQVGGHELDYQRMGIRGELDELGSYAYPDGYEPWSTPMLYDTSEPGRSNAGHEFPGLTDQQILALIEYMKLL
jgi:mono/diheme cytochrome c family protein